MEPTITVETTPAYGIAVLTLILGLALGAAGMYYYLTMMQSAAPAETTQTAQASATQVAATTSDNPYAEVQTNPYDVQVNPFQ